ncbi:MAG: hypothetical protein IJ659_09715 [Alloprevotella sp.]|nr:hypothetical protein [Alloprevotella sp.]MBR1595032.1 hypothetical protein [Alloprevotella sp.]
MSLFKRKKKKHAPKDAGSVKKAETSSAKALKELVSEEEGEKLDLSLRSILGGDILAGGWFRRHFWYIVLCIALCIVYVGNRYYVQKELILKRQLEDSIVDRRYKLITISSQITERTRRSNVEKSLADTTLKTSTTPIYTLPVEETDTAKTE